LALEMEMEEKEEEEKFGDGEKGVVEDRMKK
jgi:hypothetical protein